MASTTSTPLLMDPNVPMLISVHADTTPEQQQTNQRLTIAEVVEEVKLLYSIAFPLIAAGLLIYGKAIISMLFMGRLGKEAFAGGSLAIGVANISGYSVLSGLAMGIEAISSQAYGAKKWALIGQTLQRTILILLVISIPISLVWLYIEPILLSLGQDPTIASVASTYLYFCLPVLFCQSIINPLKIYLRTQNFTFPVTYSAAFAAALHAPINYYLIYQLGLGIKGAAMAVVIADVNLLVVLFLYISYTGVHRKTWQGWSAECFKGWKPILALAFPSCVSVCLEWWWYELMILLSGVLLNAAEAVSTMGILIQATSLAYIFPSALGSAVSTRVGNELGANRPNKAKISCHVAILCAILTSFLAMLFMTTSGRIWGKAFTKEESILWLTATTMPVVGLCELGNCPQTTGCGALRGSARPNLAVHINFGSFYGVGLPVAIILGFVMKMGLLGFCFGLLAAQAVCACLMIFVLSRTDWTVQAQRAKELISVDMENQTVSFIQCAKKLLCLSILYL